jgi:hypothetical protein
MTNGIKAPCADCQIDTLRGDNWYMVQNHIAFGHDQKRQMPLWEVAMIRSFHLVKSFALTVLRNGSDAI